jgi:hypothetical protein
MRPDDYIAVNRTTIRVAADGSMTGETEQITKGAAAMAARSFARHIQDEGVELAAQKVLRASGNPGRGRFEMPSPSNLKDPYSVKGSFALDARLDVRLPWQAIPQGMAFIRRPGEFMFAEEDERSVPFRCLAGRQIELIELVFADGLPMPVALSPRTLATRLFTYAASSTVENRTFTVRREFVSTVPGQFCKPETAAEIAEPLKLVAANIADAKLMFAKPQPEAGRKPGQPLRRAENDNAAPRHPRGPARPVAN